MSETHTQDRLLAGEVAYEFDTDAGFLRSARSGRNQDLFGRHRLDLADRDLVVALDHDLSTEFSQVLHKVVGEAVVVVENENHFFPPPNSEEKKPPILPNTPLFFFFGVPAGGASCVAAAAASRRGCSGAFSIGNSAASFRFSGAIDCNDSVIGGGRMTDSALNTSGTSSCRL